MASAHSQKQGNGEPQTATWQLFHPFPGAVPHPPQELCLPQFPACFCPGERGWGKWLRGLGAGWGDRLLDPGRFRDKEVLVSSIVADGMECGPDRGFIFGGRGCQ